MIKTAIVSVPRLEPHRPPPGPAIIANVCKAQGHEVTAFDLNIKFVHHCRKANIGFQEFDIIWDKYVEPSQEQQQFIDNFIDHWVKEIVGGKFDYIMVSVFGMACRVFTDMFLPRLRSATPAKIVAGGSAVNTTSLMDKNQCYGQTLLDAELIDSYITGEGEHAVVQYLQGGSGAGINNTHPAQIDDLDSIPLPNYEFFDLDEYDYLYPGEREVYITGSRGCVRKCTYCDVERFWPKYRYRSGISIANEIIENYERFGITRFYFTDSLVNGSLRAFNDQCDALARYRFDRPIKWSGQFIFRERRSVPKDHYQMIAEAGGDMFYVGVETGSDRVRYDMGKKFTNDDIEFQLEECSRYGIKLVFLMFSGYITETIQDHQDTLAIFPRWQRFVADGTINGVELGQLMGILPGAPMEKMISTHDVDFVFHEREPVHSLWYSHANPSLTIRERIRRKIEIHEQAIRYAWPVWRQRWILREIKQIILEHNLHGPEKKLFKISDITQLARDADTTYQL